MKILWETKELVLDKGRSLRAGKVERTKMEGRVGC